MNSYSEPDSWRYVLLMLLGLIITIASGCALFRSPATIQSGNARVTGLADAGKPATLNSGETKSDIAIPANTPVRIVKIDAVPATDKTPFQPAREEVTFVPTFDTKLQSVSTSLQANTGTVDTSIALKKIEVAENRYLLWASIGAAVAAGVFLYLTYPTPAFICVGASVVFFAAWKLSDLPDWFWAVGAVGLAAAVFLYLGHEKGLTTATIDPLLAVAKAKADAVIAAAKVEADKVLAEVKTHL